MKGSGRFGKYGDLKRKQRIRQNLHTPPVGSRQKAVLSVQDDKRRKTHVSPKKHGDQEGIAPGAGPEPPENQ
jgi:hypothetical protein